MRSFTKFLSAGIDRFAWESRLQGRGRRGRPKRATVRLQLESLENRIVPINPTVLDPNLALKTVVQLGPTGAAINPTTMVFLGDNDFLVTEKSTGKIDHVINGVVTPTHFDMGSGPINNLPVNFNSERGLLGMTLSPDFANDHLVYLYWTENNSGPAPDNNVANTPVLGNRVDRFVWNANTSTFTFDQNIVRLHSFQNDGNGGNPAQMQGNHNGGVIHFGPDGKLYIVIGDNGRRGWMQNLIDGPNGPGQTDENNGPVRGGPAPDDAHLTGVMLRLNPDGSIPDDNPFTDIRDVLRAPLLSGANEVPPSLSFGTGSFTAFLNQAEDVLTVIVSFQGLSGPTFPGGADISIGGPGATGPAVLTLNDFPGGQSSGQFTTTLTAANFTPDPADGINTFADAAQAMLNGNAYFNIHTTQNPAGDIRGQIAPASTPMGDEADIVNNIHKVFAYGIRNSFGYTFDPVTGKVWLEENGDQSFDKISIVNPGSNNGWIQSSAPLLNADGSIDTAAIAEFKAVELQRDPTAMQQTRWPTANIPNSAQQAFNQLVMLPGATYNPAVFSVRAEAPPAGLSFFTSSALGSQYQNLLFEGEARDFLTAGTAQERDGGIFVFTPNSDRSGLDFGGDPNIRTSDGVFQNFKDFDLNGDTSFLFAEGIGICTSIVTGPDGNMYLVSETKNAVYEIYNPANVAAFHSTDLVADTATPADSTGKSYAAPEKVDANLTNPWGMSFSSSSPFWVSNQHSNTSTLYAGDRTQPDGTISPITVNALVVSVPGGPTGQIRNNTTDFKLQNGTNSSFIFDTLGGSILAWGGTSPAESEVTVMGASYTGLANGSNASGNFLYAANHATGKIDVFDKTFTKVSLTGGFEDPNLPPGTAYHAFNIQNLGGTLYVAYDKVVTVGGVTDREHDGIVDAFDTNGNFLARVVTGGVNAPWGLALAPADFGPFGGDLLVGNFGFGDGKINAYQLDPTTGAGTFVGNLTDANNNPIAIEGLWAIAFGNGGSAGDTNALYFAAGIGRTGPNSFGAAHGLFGSIRFGPAPGPSLSASGVGGSGSDGGDGGATPSAAGASGSTPAAPPKAGLVAQPADNGSNPDDVGLGSGVITVLLGSTSPGQGTASTASSSGIVTSPAQQPNPNPVDQLFGSAQGSGDQAPPTTSASSSGQADGSGLDLVWADPLQNG
jgi:uncharacterized protein (TIGR03118 family)